LMLALAAPARAAGNGNSSDSLQSQIQSLKRVTTALQAQVTALQTQVSSLQSQLASANAQNAFALGQFVTVDTSNTINGLKPPHIFFTAVNLHVQDGSGFTDDNGGTLTGLGNLIIGYDELPESPPAGFRSGPHNLVVGPQHIFSSYGGFVAGESNSIERPSGSVSGGNSN